ncbi:murein hydrolase activator EnvC family protein [Pseudooceanicola sp. 200-1SW]|uniref:murein hydrolase activator EnvC family protein n=1 Tax=Pseudooceanicola sp. 200-1SW TaxID=3425949 RepID=UPI003D7F614D
MNLPRRLPCRLTRAVALLAALALLLLALFGQGAPARAAADAGGDPAALAQAAAAELEAAHDQLDGAERASDRVAALTATIAAYEKGLTAMRASLRAAALREARIAAQFDAQRDEIAALLGTLQTLSREPAPVLMLHPDGPIGTARAGMLMAEAAPALNQRVADLRARLDEARTLRALQQAAADQLQQALSGVQEARTALSQAVSDRTDLPRRFTADPMKTQLLVATAETLRAFASGLSQITQGAEDPAPQDITAQRGQIPLPVQGTVLRRAGEADAAGVTRPGVVLATRPRALVTAPVPATIRYLGPLLDYGNVMVLEPQSGLLFVLAGLDIVYGEIGEVLPEGAPLGLMGGEDPAPGAILAQSREGTGNDRSETLYMEVRLGNEPQDPLTWFAVTKDTQ